MLDGIRGGIDEGRIITPRPRLNKVQIDTQLSGFATRAESAGSHRASVLLGKLNTLLDDLAHLGDRELRVELIAIKQEAQAIMEKTEPGSPVFELAKDISTNLGKP